MSDEHNWRAICAETLRAGIERRKQKAESSFAAPSGSAATCDWLTTLEGKETCGKPATHIRRGGANLTYCYEHACKLSAYTVLEMLPPPNEKLTEVAVSDSRKQK